MHEPAVGNLSLADFRCNVCTELHENNDHENQVNRAKHIRPNRQGLLNHFRPLKNEEQNAGRQKRHAEPLIKSELFDNGAGTGIDNPHDDEEHNPVAQVIQECTRSENMFHHRTVIECLHHAAKLKRHGAHQAPTKERDGGTEQTAEHPAHAEELCDFRTRSVTAAD